MVLFGFGGPGDADGLFSFPAGPLADRFGNRLVLRMAILAICGAPLAAILLARAGERVDSAFMFVFLLVGLTPVTIKTLNNYTLEILQIVHLILGDDSGCTTGSRGERPSCPFLFSTFTNCAMTSQIVDDYNQFEL